MAFLAAHRTVDPREREAVVEMDLLDVVNQPVVGRVAPGTVVPHRLLVDVLVARNAVVFGRFKDQGFVAVAAIHAGMPAGQGKIRLVVVEFAGVNGKWQSRRLGFRRLVKFDVLPIALCYRPACRGMAGSTVQFQGCAVWVLRQ